MKSSIRALMKTSALAAALAVAASGIARADDSSMNPLTGDSYAAFNGGNSGSNSGNPAFDREAPTWRQDNPQGVPERVFQSYSASASGEAWKLSHPMFASAIAAPSFQEARPTGLTEPELQALSSEALGRRLNGEPGAAAILSPDYSAVAQGTTPESPAQRVASFFHRDSNRSTQ